MQQGKTIGILMLVTFTLALIGMAVFTDFKERGYKVTSYGWACFLGWGGAAAALIAGIITLLVSRSQMNGNIIRKNNNPAGLPLKQQYPEEGV